MPPSPFAPDSLVEGRRFELSVPPEKDWPYETIVIDLPAPSGPREEVTPSREGPRVNLLPSTGEFSRGGNKISRQPASALSVACHADPELSQRP